MHLRSKEPEIVGKGDFLAHHNSNGRKDIEHITKLITALRVLAYGHELDAIDELCGILATSVRNDSISFIELFIQLYGEWYLRYPSKDDLKRITTINHDRGFPGCIGLWY